MGKDLKKGVSISHPLNPFDTFGITYGNGLASLSKKGLTITVLVCYKESCVSTNLV